MMAVWGGGEGMVPEKRQEQLPYLSWQLSVLTTCTGFQNAGSH